MTRSHAACRTVLQVIFLVLGLCGFAPNELRDYHTNIAALDDARREDYRAIQELLDDWAGERWKLDTAGDMIAAFVEAEPDFLPIYIEEVRHHLMMGSTEGDYPKACRDALPQLQAIKARDPHYAKSYRFIGHVLLHLGRLDEAHASLMSAFERDPTDPWTFVNLARYYERVHEPGLGYLYSRRALLLSEDHVKAAMVSLEILRRTADHAPPGGARFDPVAMLFKGIEAPLRRLRVAERIFRTYRGNQTILVQAMDIVARQKQETPDLPEAILLQAGILQQMAYEVNEGPIATYQQVLAGVADDLLTGLEDIDRFAYTVFRIRMELAVGTGQFPKAKRILEQAATGRRISARQSAYYRAYVGYAEGRYAEAAKILETAGDFEGDTLLAYAYEQSGDPSRTKQLFEKDAREHPQDAWALGNYAAILLSEGDLDGAIRYGERALAVMSYPLGRKHLVLAYLARASRRLQSGDESAASQDFMAAKTWANGTSLEALVIDVCAISCTAIAETIRHFSD